MTYYSLLYLLAATLEPSIVEETQTKILDILSKYKSEIIKVYEPEKRKLSYAIKHVRHGIYTNINFNIQANQLEPLTKELQLAPNILRFLLTKEKTFHRKPKRSTQPTAPTQITPPVPVQDSPKPAPAKTKINLEELDKKIDEILDN